jgi:hypothetical protein
MTLRPRTIVLGTCAAALLVFAIVQDRVTAAGAREYVALQRAAFAGRSVPVTIDQVLRPAVDRSVRQGAAWAGAVMLVGVGMAMVARRE